MEQRNGKESKISKIMKTSLLVSIISLCIISCQEKKDNKKISNMNVLNEAPYNISDEGDGLKINYDTLSNKITDKAKKDLVAKRFKFPNDLLFKSRIYEVYNFAIEKYNNKILVLRSAMFPEIAIKNDNYILVQDYEFERNYFINAEYLYYYNDYIFYNNKISFDMLKLKYPESLKDLVVLFGYVSDDKIAKFVLEKYDYKSFYEFKDLIFDRKENKYILREQVLNKIIEYNYHGKTEDLSYAKEGDGFLRIGNILEFIKKNANQVLNPDRTVAILFEKELEVGITGDIEEKLNNDSSYKDFLIRNNYYGFDRLKNYVENLWGQDQNGFNDNSIYKINDPDGYTNLRKEKNTSSEILQKINTGSEVQVFDNSGDWWLIQTKEGKKGYVYKTKIKEE
jgi:hypothetical protein